MTTAAHSPLSDLNGSPQHPSSHDVSLSTTVVVPCLNRAHFLRPTIDSILQQRGGRVECIVVDGGSTDGTQDILRSYGDRIQWVSEPDGGHAAAINKGWRMGGGDVVAWLNADDTFAHPDALATACDYLAQHPEVDVVYGECLEIDEAGTPVGRVYSRRFNLRDAVETCDHCVPQPAAFIRRATLERVGFLDESLHQKKDHELWLRIGLHGTIRFIPQVLACERNVPGLSFDVATAAPACLKITNRFFAQEQVPDEFWRRRSLITSNACLRACDYAFDGGPQWHTILRYASAALWHAPSNWREVIRRLNRYRLRRRPRRVDAMNDRALITMINGWLAPVIGSGSGLAVVYEQVESDLPLRLAAAGWGVTAMAPAHRRWGYKHPNLRFTRDPFPSVIRDFVDGPELLVVVLPGGKRDAATQRLLETAAATDASRLAIIAPCDLFNEMIPQHGAARPAAHQACFAVDRLGRWETHPNGQITALAQDERRWICAAMYDERHGNDDAS